MALSLRSSGSIRVKADAGGIVDADMDELPADATGPALAGALAGDAVACAIEPAQLLDVDVDQFAGMFALIAAHRLGRFQGLEPVQAQPLEDTADGRRRDARCDGNCLAGQALTAQGFDAGNDRLWRGQPEPFRP